MVASTSPICGQTRSQTVTVELQAATEIQRVGRGYNVRQTMRTWNDSATQMQKLARGFSARCLVTELRRRRHNYEVCPNQASTTTSPDVTHTFARVRSTIRQHVCCSETFKHVPGTNDSGRALYVTLSIFMRVGKAQQHLHQWHGVAERSGGPSSVASRHRTKKEGPFVL